VKKLIKLIIVAMPLPTMIDTSFSVLHGERCDSVCDWPTVEFLQTQTRNLRSASSSWWIIYDFQFDGLAATTFVLADCQATIARAREQRRVP